MQNYTDPADRSTDTGFVDQFNAEFSRDIEPMKGGFTDNYFYQMCSVIRRFKGVLPADGVSGANTMIETDADVLDKWETVYPVYTDFTGDTSRRDHADTTGTRRYVNETGRNDIVESRIIADGDNLYVYVRTAEEMTSYKDSKNWMLLFIDGRLVADGSYDPEAQDGVMTVKGSIILAKGYHALRVEYAEVTGAGAHLALVGDGTLYYGE